MNMLEAGLTYDIKGEVRVCAPNDLRLMTPYVLTEQEDWFEDEIKFVRLLIQKGNVIVDVGANYGVYTLVSARRTGEEGRVIAFEPCAATAKWLRESVSINRFSNVTVIGKAVSNHPGKGKLTSEGNSELNRLEASSEPAGGEIVELTTLDETLRAMALSHVDFVKIDAEGHEVKVIEGGYEFFSSLSPLVMCEIKAGDQVDLSPLGKLANFGYAAYKLAPGLNVLVPFDASKPIDGYQLNIFCCKPDRVGLLSSRGLLVTQQHLGTEVPDTDQWRFYIAQLAYAKPFMTNWVANAASKPEPGWEKYRHILNLYALSSGGDQPISIRHAYQMMSYQLLAELIKTEGNFSRLLTFARIALDVGERAMAVASLKHAMDGVKANNNSVFIGEPFVPPSAAFEHINPGENIANWAMAALLDAFESKRAFSSYFSPKDTVAIVSELRRLGYCSEAMNRRYRLANTRV